MNDFTMKIPTFKELEHTFFALLSNNFVEEFVDDLHMMDEKIMELRDKNRYRLKDHRERTIQTLFGEVTFQRRLYEDRTTGQTVYLLDQYLSMEKGKSMSPYLEEWAIRLAAEGTSYRKAANFLEKWFGKPVLSHETIRQKLIERGMFFQEEAQEESKPKADVLFIEVDGIHTSIQQSKRKSKEHRMALVHRGWEKRGDRYELQDKHYYRHEGKEDFWEGFGAFILEHDDVDEKTWWIVSGDGAEWIKACENDFRNVIFVIDRFHLARELKEHLKDHPEAYEQAREAFLAYVVQGVFPYLANTSRTHSMHQALRGLKGI